MIMPEIVQEILDYLPIEPLVKLVKVGRGRRVETDGYGEPSLYKFAKNSIIYVVWSKEHGNNQNCFV
jgi:hypothetical protein